MSDIERPDYGEIMTGCSDEDNDCEIGTDSSRNNSLSDKPLSGGSTPVGVGGVAIRNDSVCGVARVSFPGRMVTKTAVGDGSMDPSSFLHPRCSGARSGLVMSTKEAI